MLWETMNGAGKLLGAAASSGATDQTVSDVIDSPLR